MSWMSQLLSEFLKSIAQFLNYMLENLGPEESAWHEHGFEMGVRVYLHDRSP